MSERKAQMYQRPLPGELGRELPTLETGVVTVKVEEGEPKGVDAKIKIGTHKAELAYRGEEPYWVK